MNYTQLQQSTNFMKEQHAYKVRQTLVIKGGFEVAG